MKQVMFFILCASLVGCAESEREQASNDTKVITDTTFPSVLPETTVNEPGTQSDSIKPLPVYANARFKDVTVNRIEDTYRVRGKAQVFEAAFSWVVEDGHNELKKGFEMTDAGAPEFGNFDFRITVKKARENSVMHLILFESSPKDGSRQHELMIPLP